MNRTVSRRPWIKLYPIDCLDGSIRYQLEPDERSVWYDLLNFSAICATPGIISDKDGRPYPKSFIANRLNIPLELLETALKKCVEEGRIQEINGGVLEIVNWGAYQSEYLRQKKYRGGSLPKDKKQYGEFKNILLTDDEYQKLLQRFGQAETNTLIENLSRAIESKGYRYKSHYATILNWARREDEKKPVNDARIMGSVSHKKCPKCDYNERTEKTYCPKCGEPLEKDYRAGKYGHMVQG